MRRNLCRLLHADCARAFSAYRLYRSCRHARAKTNCSQHDASNAGGSAATQAGCMATAKELEATTLSEASRTRSSAALPCFVCDQGYLSARSVTMTVRQTVPTFSRCTLLSPMRTGRAFFCTGHLQTLVQPRAIDSVFQISRTNFQLARVAVSLQFVNGLHTLRPSRRSRIARLNECVSTVATDDIQRQDAC